MISFFSIDSAKGNFSLSRLVSWSRPENDALDRISQREDHFMFGCVFRSDYGAVSKYM